MNRSDLINKLIASRGYKSYLEIGVKAGETFERVAVAHKTGVDPNLALLKPRYRPGVLPTLRRWAAKPRGSSYWTYADGRSVRLLEMTSDRYFAEFDDRYDLCFVDGLHTFDQVIQDYIHCQAHLNDGGCVVLHDCNPSTATNAARERSADTRDWNGDTWKAVYYLRRHGQAIQVFDCDYGLGVAFKQDPAPHLSREEFEELLTLPFEVLAEDRSSAIGLTDWSERRYQELCLG